MKVLVTGRSGQVARELQLLLDGECELLCLGHDELDLRDVAAIRSKVREFRPDVLINAAAYTAVDQAESEPDKAFAINAVAPAVLAEEAARVGAVLVHYSTDYVFDGNKSTPYTEEDCPAPLGIYGRSKLEGENAIREVAGDYLILRTSWVYATHGRNFLLTMQRLLQEREVLNVVADQIGAPTWAGTIAQTTCTLINHWRKGRPGPWGTYHLTAQGETSWFGFAEAIALQMQAQGLLCARLTPIPASDYPTPARRPLNSRLDCTRLKHDWQIELPNWQEALLDCLKSPRPS
ncbi:dTDP-4-dehydrorhamnose reductase [compost metagenome]